MNPTRRRARIAGTCYLTTVATSIPALALKAPILADPSRLATAAGQTALHWAALLEVVLALTCIGTAVALFPVVRRVEESSALGFVATRTLEASIIIVGILAMLALAALPRDASVVANPSLDAALVSVHDWAFLIGPGVMPAINALLLGSLLFRSGLVPRVIPAVGLVGAPLLLASDVGTLFGLVDQVSPVGFLAAVPIAAWEITLGVWLVVRGFRLAPVEAYAVAASR